MRNAIALLAGLGLLLTGAGVASAASPEYCNLYAREYSARAAAAAGEEGPQPRVFDSAYFKCLNMDAEPALPAAFTGSAAADESVSGEGDASPANEEIVEAPALDEQTPAVVAPARKPARKKSASVSRQGSGLTAWSEEWKAWCREHYPRSFDPKTGTVVPLSTGKRTFCR
jgi:hypothetical protein